MGDTAGSIATLKFATGFQQVHTYPIVNDDRAIGLVRAFREAIAYLRYEIEAGRTATVTQGTRLVVFFPLFFLFFFFFLLLNTV
jgi:hypothetical protein